MNELTFTARDGYVLVCYLWDDVEQPKGVLQITHGMAEHAVRYKRFAEFLNKNGYIVFANDIRAHGKSAGDIEKLGKKTDDGNLFEETVMDQVELSNYLTAKYNNLPLFLLGHSYGSFLTQKYIQLCQIPKAVILMGSANQKGALTSVAHFIANITKTFKGVDAPAKMLANMSFGQYQKNFNEGAWITSDKVESDKYESDPYCGTTFSAGFYIDFLHSINNLYKKKDMDRIPKDYPIFIVSGEEDPVGGPIKLITKLYNTYLENGLNNVEFKLYPNMRHEILNEIGKEKPMQDILEFLNKNL